MHAQLVCGEPGTTEPAAGIKPALSEVQLLRDEVQVRSSSQTHSDDTQGCGSGGQQAILGAASSLMRNRGSMQSPCHWLLSLFPAVFPLASGSSGRVERLCGDYQFAIFERRVDEPLDWPGQTSPVDYRYYNALLPRAI